jgi:hypothetical protein
MRPLSLLLVLVAACTSTAKTEPAKTEPAKAEPAKAEPTSEAPKVHACNADADCMASCHHGAVSRAWHTKTYPGGEACEDGCTSKGTEAPRCESNTCVAYRAGARDAMCTGLDVEAIAGPGPAHRCGVDGDCVTTCEHGAVNKEWLSWQKPTECGGGCTNPGHQAPKCEDGRCVAYRDGKPQASCTEKPIAR